MSFCCGVSGCKTSLANKMPGVNLHPIPSSQEMKNKWLDKLKSKCTVIAMNKTRICSKHFERRCFDNQRRLRDNAVPTIFPMHNKPKTKVARMLSTKSVSQLADDIKESFLLTPEPVNLSEFVGDDCRTEDDAPMEAKLWLMIKKQEYLINRLSEQNNKFKAQLQDNDNNISSEKRESEKSIATLKHIVKSLHEKQSALEEQIEILSAVESR